MIQKPVFQYGETGFSVSFPDGLAKDYSRDGWMVTYDALSFGYRCTLDYVTDRIMICLCLTPFAKCFMILILNLILDNKNK